MSEALNWRSSPAKRIQARLIAAAGVSPDCGARIDAALAHRRSRASRSDRGERAPADHGVLARAHSPRHLLLSPPRHRRHHEREFRRRVDCGHHRTVRIRDRAGLDVAERTESAAAADARDGGGEAGRIHARWTAGPGARGAARRRVAGEGDGEPRAAVSSRGQPSLDAEKLGPHADPQALRDGLHRDGRAVRRAVRCGRRGDRDRRRGCSSSACWRSKRGPSSSLTQVPIVRSVTGSSAGP